jgi:EAL domain-containing protein (putative c-di-GMP-specific phosphodiesterase class I)/GGDEF domain-containing protein
MSRGLDDLLRLQILAYGHRHDIQTGLLNYRAFQEEVDSRLQHGPREQEVATVWVELLNLRSEFALRGWEASEAIVRRFASALRSAAGDDALVGRFSGRCFVFSMRAGKSDPSGRRRIQDVVDALAETTGRGLEDTPEVAAGVAFYPSDAGGAEDLVRFASMAAARARYTRSSSVLSFHSGMNNVLKRNHQLEVEIGKALDRNQFSMLFQPKVDLVSGRVLGAEALMRWSHVEWGPVPPSEFIPIAERSSLIQRVFDFSLRSALENARRWIELGIAPGIISVNVSAANLRRENFAQRVGNLLAELPISPIELELEVTESMLLDDAELFTRRMRQLKAIGVRIAIDDFGTRYTGFDLLKRLPVDAMKIDRCFIRGIHRSQDMRSLCSTIIAMARHMKLCTVAEGIEELEELDVMQQIGCDAGQGYFFQRPIGAEDFTSFLRGWPLKKRGIGFAISGGAGQADPLFGMT